VIDSWNITRWGDWGRWEYCAEGTFAIGFKLKGLNFVYARDQVGMLGIRLYCGKPGSKSYWKNQSISSTVGHVHDSTWGITNRCHGGLLIGFNLMGEENRGSRDDAGATNIRMRCSNQNVGTILGDLQPLLGIWGREDKVCSTKQAICGIQTQVERSANDISGLNNVRFLCCNIPDPGSTCTPDDRWSEIVGCENLSPHEVNCTYEYKRGISHTDTTAVSGFDEFSTLVTVGFSLGASGTYLSANFNLNLGFSSTTSTNWETMSQETYFEYTIVRLDFGVPPGMYYVLKQVEGVCGGFHLGVIKFNFTAYEGGKELVQKEMTSVQLESRRLMD